MRVLKVSALYDAWRSKKRRKTNKCKNYEKYCVFRYFCQVLEDLRQKGRHQQIPLNLLLQIHPFSALFVCLEPFFTMVMPVRRHQVEQMKCEMFLRRS